MLIRFHLFDIKRAQTLALTVVAHLRKHSQVGCRKNTNIRKKKKILGSEVFI